MLVMALALVGILGVASYSAQAKDVTIHLKDTLRFDRDIITALPGEEITLTVVNDGSALHSFTLFAERDPDVPVGDDGALQAYNATHAKVVEVWLQAGEEETVTFSAPTQEGTYVFVCMEELHAVGGMHGELIVGETGGLSPVVIGVIVGVVAVVAVVVFLFFRRGRA